MQQIRSIWLVSTKSIGLYRKFKTHHVVNDVRAELSRYSSFGNVPRNVLEDRICNGIRQSLRVRGINWLAKLRTRFITYENSLTKQIRTLEEEVIREKRMLQENWPDLEDPNTSIKNVMKYYHLRENYLKAKVKLDCLIEHRRIITKQLKSDADDILHEK